ncbi:MAG: PAS domain S-box protein [Deltaproteobacteria bacterium]|nr:PAS domain S-box protein [Deltaproteobacteria bacterium]
MEDGQFKGARGILIDITDQRRVEEALRESEKKYRWMVDNMADVITVIDLNLRFTYVSPAIMRLRGYTAEEATAQTLEQVMTPESLQIIAKVFEEEMKLEASGTADPGRSRILELEQYKKDGSIVWIENDLSFIRDEAQKPVGIISLSRDITDRKRAEEELLSKTKSLEELNTALKVLIDHYKNDQREFEERIVSNIRVSIIPYIEKIKRTRLDIDQSAIIEIIERSFRDISSPFLKSISSEYFRFTTKEIEIVSLIKDGKTTKEIAQILCIGKRTVDSYRNYIRGKLRLANKKVNLRTYLLSISNT